MTAVQDPPETPPAQPTEVRGGFSLDSYLAQFNRRMFTIPECRRLLTKHNPLLFALTYLGEHLKETDESPITLSEFHVELAEAAKRWAIPATEPRQNRDAYICPREAGKSTWLFLILPLWAAAHGHRKFIAAFADSGPQAEKHLLTFKKELDRNRLLRADYPDLCRPAKRPGGGNESDTKSMLVAASGVVFSAKGVDSKTLGLKIGRRRPDLLILDDIEPDESNYSDYQKDKRLATVQNAILPLNIRARVVIAGTVTMPGSIIHDLVKTITRPGEDPAEWVVDEKIRVHYYRAIITDDKTGERRSLWPTKWPMAFLAEIEKTRPYKLNYDNNPLARNGPYWNEDDFTYAEIPDLTHQIISVDPAVTSTGTSDYTAIAVIAYSARHKRVVVRDAWAIRVPPGEQLRNRLLGIIGLYPQTRGIVVESNQGGDVWRRSVLRNMPVKVRAVRQSEHKETRATRLLTWYQTRPLTKQGLPADELGLPYVVHAKPLHQVEEQMVGFPNAAHDDLVDAIGTGVDVFLGQKKTARVVVTGPPGGDDDEDGF